MSIYSRTFSIKLAKHPRFKVISKSIRLDVYIEIGRRGKKSKFDKQPMYFKVIFYVTLIPALENDEPHSVP